MQVLSHPPLVSSVETGEKMVVLVVAVGEDHPKLQRAASEHQIVSFVVVGVS